MRNTLISSSEAAGIWTLRCSPTDYHLTTRHSPTDNSVPTIKQRPKPPWDTIGDTPNTQAKDLSKENPEKLHELQRLWLIEAVKYNVLPLDDRQALRFTPRWPGGPR